MDGFVTRDSALMFVGLMSVCHTVLVFVLATKVRINFWGRCMGSRHDLVVTEWSVRCVSNKADMTDII